MLKISRPDIDSESITEFPADKRFIKLPIINYLKLLPAYDPDTGETSSAWDQVNRAQIALINAVNNPKYRFICAALARRLGKTYIANVIGQLVMLVPGCNILIISPNYTLSSISFELQRRLIRAFDLEVDRDNVKDKILELTNGSTIRLGSLSTVDSCVGRSYDLIIFDEAALGDGEAAFNVALRPTLDRPGAKAIFISTPRGKNNWFSRFFDRGFSDKYPEWASVTADYTENPRMSESDVLEARTVMSKAEFEQEYMASFSTYEGQIFKFDEDSCVEEYVPQDGDELIAGLDPGYKDPTAFVVLVYRPQTESYHVVDEYQESQATTEGHVEHIRRLMDKWNLDTIFIDSAAAQFAADLAYTYDIATIKAKKSVLDGIGMVATLIEQGKVKVSPHCEHVLVMLNEYRWDNKTNLSRERPEHGMASHCADAMRYAIYTYTTGG
jgi:phage terminase large subunit